jgi:hypothetical protein
MNKPKWKERIDWCHFFGEVVDVLDELGVPQADNVGAAHLWWARPDTDPMHLNPSNALASVTLGGFGNRRVYFRCGSDMHDWGYAETPELIRSFGQKMKDYLEQNR